MNYDLYMAQLMRLGYETGRGNQNAFNEVFGENPPHQDDPEETEQDQIKAETEAHTHPIS